MGYGLIILIGINMFVNIMVALYFLFSKVDRFCKERSSKKKQNYKIEVTTVQTLHTAEKGVKTKHKRKTSKRGSNKKSKASSRSNNDPFELSQTVIAQVVDSKYGGSISQLRVDQDRVIGWQNDDIEDLNDTTELPVFYRKTKFAPSKVPIRHQ